MVLPCQMAVTAWDLSGPQALAQIPEQARQAEALGFSGFWLPEHHFQGEASLSAPLILLAGCASITRTIDLGTTSLLLPIRNPTALAEETATLDVLAGGRLILGLGRGVDERLFHVFDLEVKEKRKLFKTALLAMLSAWQGESLLPDDSVILSPRPAQRPHPRLWIAAFGPLALKQAAHFGCPYLASPMESLSQLKTNLDIYHEALATEGQPRPDKVPIMRTIFITENARQAQAIKHRLSEQLRSEDPVEPPYWVGSKGFVEDRLQAHIETLGMNYLIARGRIPGVSVSDQIASHETLLTLAE